ncbi:MAG: hypothetical protein JWM98_2306 [Thermoleophilia bacterium]|nr:hypothetical protein [Thermoleophilia bacterium]
MSYEPIDATVSFHRLLPDTMMPMSLAKLEEIGDLIDLLKDAGGDGSRLEERALRQSGSGGPLVAHRGPGVALHLSISRVQPDRPHAYNLPTGDRRVVPLGDDEGVEHRSFAWLREDGLLSILRPPFGPTAKALTKYLFIKPQSIAPKLFLHNELRGSIADELARRVDVDLVRISLADDEAARLADAPGSSVTAPNDTLERMGGRELVLELRDPARHGMRSMLGGDRRRLRQTAAQIYEGGGRTGATFKTFIVEGRDRNGHQLPALNMLEQALTERVTVAAATDRSKALDEASAWAALDRAVATFDAERDAERE